MKLRLFLLLLLLGGVRAHGQKTPDDYMEEARMHQYMQHKPNVDHLEQHDSIALADYRYIVEQHPKSTLCLAAYYDIARIYERQGREADAIATYHKVIALAMDTKPKKEKYNFNNEGNEAARSLCDYHEKRGNYDSALYYLGIYDTVLRMFYGCGNAAAADQHVTIIRYADIYLRAHRVRDAEIVLLQDMQPDLLSSNEEIAKKLRELFTKYEKAQNLRSEMEKAVNSYFSDTDIHTEDDRTDTFISFGINFLGAKIRGICSNESLCRLASGNAPPALWPPGREQIVAYLRKSDVYKLVQKL